MCVCVCVWGGGSDGIRNAGMSLASRHIDAQATKMGETVGIGTVINSVLSDQGSPRIRMC